MILSCNDLPKYVHGAVLCKEENSLCTFHRFTDIQRDYYDSVRPDFHFKTQADSSIRIEFETDASAVSFEATAHTASSRKYCYLDAACDGVLVFHGGKKLESEEEILSFRFDLPDGIHRVCIYLPNLAFVRIGEMVLENASLVRKTEKSRTILCLGDSITQGYDALYPSLSYVNALADALDADVVNQAIGGEVFRSGMLDKINLPFDFITVAYGTNDWTHKLTREEFEGTASDYFRRLKELYPKTKILYISPIWRRILPEDEAERKPCPDFDKAVRVLEQIAETEAGAVLVHGGNLTPHLPDFYSDGYLHPNDLGFTFYSKNLIREIHKKI